MPRVVRRAVIAGMVLALVPLLWMLFGGRAELTNGGDTRNFYDEQVAAWSDGHWNMPPYILGVEAWWGPKGPQMYFGPLPALLRVPTIAAADALGWSATGHLTQPHMALALVALLGGVGGAWWRVRTLLRGDSTVPVTRGELVAVAGSVAFVGLGSVVIYLAAFPSVYHEANLTGAALALWALLKLLDVTRYGRPRDAGWAALLTVATVQTRASVGLGPVVAAGLLAVVWLAVRCRPSAERRLASVLAPGLHVDQRRRHDLVLLWLVVAAVVSVGSFAAVNHVRFGTWFSLPLAQHGVAQLFPEAFVAAVTDHYRMYRPAFILTNVVGYFRPGGLTFGGLPPWVDLTLPQLVGSTPLAGTQPTGSITTTMPLFVGLGAVGAAALLRTASRRALVALRLVAIGALAPCLVSLAFMWIAHRFLGDWLPFMVLLGVVGVNRLTAVVSPSNARWSRLARMSVVTIVVLLAVWGVFVNGAVALEHQRFERPFTAAMRYEFVRWQHWADGYERKVTPNDHLPGPGPLGTLAIVGDCEALAWSTGYGWMILEGRVLDRHLPEGTIPFVLGSLSFLQSPLRSDRPPDLCWKVKAR